MKLLEFTKKGIYCAKADIYIDPHRKVDKAIITHAHADHAKPGHKYYLCHELCAPVLKLRLGKKINVQTMAFGESVSINGVQISMHPSGHIIGAAQIRLSYKGEIWVVTGDFKTENDGISGLFESINCHYLITECTFGLPIYQWRPQKEIFNSLNHWCKKTLEQGITPVIMGYSLGKSQRIIQGLDPAIGPVYTHNSIENVNKALRDQGVPIRETTRITAARELEDSAQGIIITPPSTVILRWIKQRKPFMTAAVSGWMALNKMRKNRSADVGFVLSDHADWKGLNDVISSSGAEYIIATHGYTHSLVKWLRDQGKKASVESTEDCAFAVEVES